MTTATYPIGGDGNDSDAGNTILEVIYTIIIITFILPLLEEITSFVASFNFNNPYLDGFTTILLLTTFVFIIPVIFSLVRNGGKISKKVVDKYILYLFIFAGIYFLYLFYVGGINSSDNVEQVSENLEDTGSNIWTDLGCKLWNKDSCDLQEQTTQEATGSSRTDDFKIGLDTERTIALFNYEDINNIKPLELYFELETSSPITIEKIDCYYKKVDWDTRFDTITFEEPERIERGNEVPYLCNHNPQILGTLIDEGDTSESFPIHTVITYSVEVTISKDIIVVNYPFYDLNQEKSVEDINFELDGLSELIIDPEVLEVAVRGLDDPVIIGNGEAKQFTMVIDINLDGSSRYGDIINSELTQSPSVSSLIMEEHGIRLVRNDERAFISIKAVENENEYFDGETRIQKMVAKVKTTFEEKDSTTASFINMAKYNEQITEIPT